MRVEMHRTRSMRCCAISALLSACSAAVVARPARAGRAAASATKPLHVKIDAKWYDVSAWADSHPGGRYALEWADGHDITGAFHTIHLFSGSKASDILKRLPEGHAASARVLPQIDRQVGHGRPTGMDAFMNGGERVVQLVSPVASRVPAPVEVAAASDLSWQQGHQGEYVLGQSSLKDDLEKLLHKHFDSPADYKATPEHWLRIASAICVWVACFAGWLQCDTASTLLLPFAQWLVFSPTVHEASHSTLSTKPWVNKAMAFCGLPFIYHPYVWWPQHILSHHQYTNDDALDVDLHHLRPSRLHPGCEPDKSASGFNFIFKGYFSTMGMAVLWPLRNLQRKSTGRW